MKQFLPKLTVLLVLLTVFLFLPAVIQAQEAASLDVAVAAICQDVVDREPVDAGVRFAASVGTLYCFTKITGAQEATQITHVWYFGAEERARVDLDVNSSTWRTWSSKNVEPSWTGDWRVVVVSEDGSVLGTVKFSVN